MLRLSRKLIPAVLALILVFAFAGCDYDIEYSLESTAVTKTERVSETTSSEKYIRSSFNTFENPYFAMLSEAEMDAYSLIYEELSQGNREFECRIRLNADQLTNAIDSVLNDHPELFWIDNNYGYSYDPEDGTIKEIKFTFFDFADTPEKWKAAKSRFEIESGKIVDKALAYPTLAERELFIHDYICENTEYDVNAPYNQSAYSAIVLHRSVCAGYSRSFQYLMQKAGFTCYYVTGRADGISGLSAGAGYDEGAHSWNLVMLNGQFYNMDCLWDDTASDTYGSMIYPFFNITDDALIHHERTGMAVLLPRCTATEYKYSNHFGPTVEADSIRFTEG